MAQIDNPTFEQLTELVKRNHYLMIEENVGEGIVIKNYDYRNRFGEIVWAKLINDNFDNRSGSNKAKVSATNLNQNIEQEIAQRYCNEFLVNKEYSKIINDDPGVEKKILIPRLIENVFHSLFEDDLYDACKYHKLPTINFSLLKKECVKTIREIMPNLFTKQ